MKIFNIIVFKKIIIFYYNYICILCIYNNRKRSRDVSSDEESDFSDTSEADAKLVEEVESYGPDLIKDEEDRRYLDNLPEIEREAIIAERAEKKQILKERLEVKRKLKQGKMNKSNNYKYIYY
ncbi:hypothetical protein LY90DRAFT_64701 [Neocallimastix californiae]|uniref:Uncharacterized protein n=1 Tax=Neocallimastix californiae TaxID=1754190 RepID=A0A1Y2BI74_9FUNG|nr:hypothetical protein LY90DRAFT_64701 [Neocallimastix californiae]|eukprot:ORY34492.1 hypothetical protein LY90DRAFT_64701 [Neocallimastix californiae]